MKIDIHAHIIVPQALRTSAAHEAWRPRVWRDEAGRQWLEHSGKTIGAARREFVDIERILEEQSEAEVDLTLLSPWSSLFNYDLEPLAGLATCRLQNEALAQLVSDHPRRLAGLAAVPLQDPALAAQELARSMENLGLAGAEIGTNVNGTYLGDDRFEPFWAEAARRQAFVFIHPVSGVGGPVMGQHYLWNLMGNPMETGLTAAHMILKGVLERHPDLMICLAHAGGTLPYLIGRLDRGFAVQDTVKAHISETPRAYLRRFYFDTISHDPVILGYLISLIGPEQVLMGSDYPFDMGMEHPTEMVAALEGISAEERAGIMGGNAARLLMKSK